MRLSSIRSLFPNETITPFKTLNSNLLLQVGMAETIVTHFQTLAWLQMLRLLKHRIRNCPDVFKRDLSAFLKPKNASLLASRYR